MLGPYDFEGDADRAAAELASGRPRAKFDELLAAQGADLDAFAEQLKPDSTAPVVREFLSPAEGHVAQCDARLIGELVRDLGGGRQKQDSEIHPDVGIDQLAKPGEPVKAGAVLARIHARNEAEAEAALARLGDAFEISKTLVEPKPLIHEII